MTLTRFHVIVLLSFSALALDILALDNLSRGWILQSSYAQESDWSRAENAKKHFNPPRAVSAKVQRDGDRFRVRFEVAVNAPAKQVQALLTDFKNLSIISPSTIDSGWVVAGADRQLRVVIKACVLIFCKTMTKLSHVEEQDDGVSIFHGISQGSSFSVAQERLQVSSLSEDDRREHERDGQSIVIYDASLVPHFSVPQVVRGWMVQYVLERDIVQTLVNVETIVSAVPIDMPVRALTTRVKVR